MPLDEVLAAIAETAPLELHSRGTAVADPVSLNIEAPDWRDLLSQLLGREGYVLSFDADTGEPRRLDVEAITLTGQLRGPSRRARTA